MLKPRTSQVYSPAEYWSDAAVHMLGVLAALIAVPTMIAATAMTVPGIGAVAAAAVYGVTLIAMLSCSALYNMTRAPRWRPLLKRIDQSAIYLKIAGTYTPFAVLSGVHAGPFLAGVWGAAGLGAALVTFGARNAWVKWAALALYLGIGWAGAFWGGPLVAGLSGPGFVLLLLGGLLYSGGVVFLLWERLPFHNTIWHVFVLAATVLCYAAVMVELFGAANA
jgi:hemolysin III